MIPLVLWSYGIVFERNSLINLRQMGIVTTLYTKKTDTFVSVFFTFIKEFAPLPGTAEH